MSSINETYINMLKSLRSIVEKQAKEIESLKQEKIKGEQKSSSCSLCNLRESLNSSNSHSLDSYFKHSKKSNLDTKIEELFSGLNKELKKIKLKIHHAQLRPATDENGKTLFDVSKFPIDENSKIKKFLYWKDRALVSDKSYDALHQINKVEIPSKHSIIKYRKELNKKCEINQIGQTGLFYNVKKVMLSNIYKFIDENSNCNQNLKIKLSADATNIGWSRKITNVTFTIINDPDKCMAASGNFTLGIVIGKDNFTNLKAPFNHIKSIIKNLKRISYNEKEYNVEYFFGGDWVVTACLLGIKGANSKYPCLWCLKGKHQFGDLKLFSRRRNLKLHRTLLSKKNEDQRFGCVNESLLGEIENSNCVIDTLHLLLRVSDFLIDEFIRRISSEDGYTDDKFEKLNSFFLGEEINENKKYMRLLTFLNFIQNECGVKLQLTKCNLIGNLRGPQKKKIFKKVHEIGLLQFFKNVKQIKEIDELWRNFYSIYTQITSLGEISYTSIKDQTS
jgi:hypothetical protein